MGYNRTDKPVNTKGLKTNYATKSKTPICYESHPNKYRSGNIGKGTHTPNNVMRTKGK